MRRSIRTLWAWTSLVALVQGCASGGGSEFTPPWLDGSINPASGAGSTPSGISAGGGTGAAPAGNTAGALFDGGAQPSGVAADGGTSAAPPSSTGGLPDGGVQAANSDGGGVDGSVNRDGGALPDADAQAPLGNDAGGVDGGTDAGGQSDAGGVDGGMDGDFARLTAPLPPGTDYSGWTWVDVAGSKCRDGSGAGYYWRRGKKASLMVFLNGGGACADPFFCGINPVNVNQNLPIEVLTDGTLNLLFGADQQRQVAPDEGVFKRDSRNPVADWNMVYVPYCTGDIHSGWREDVVVDGVDGKQQFVGAKNLGLFLKSFGPSFMNAPQVLLTGSSAGGFGALFNFDRFQQFFKSQEVLAVSDSGPPMGDKYMAPCLQGRWRSLWGLNDGFPKECTACAGDAGGLSEAALAYYFGDKYKGRFLGGIISTVNDQIIRAFFSTGMNANAGEPDNCTLEPSLNTITSSLGLGQYSGDKYREGLADIVDNLVSPTQAGFYMIPGDTHMHLFRARFYEQNGNTQTIAEWLADILAKKPTRQGDQLLHPK